MNKCNDYFFVGTLVEIKMILMMGLVLEYGKSKIQAWITLLNHGTLVIILESKTKEKQRFVLDNHKYWEDCYLCHP